MLRGPHHPPGRRLRDADAAPANASREVAPAPRPGSPFDPERPGAYFARMERRTLPVGIQSLGEIRRMDCYYVDKTAHVLRLTREVGVPVSNQ